MGPSKIDNHSPEKINSSMVKCSIVDFSSAIDMSTSAPNTTKYLEQWTCTFPLSSLSFFCDEKRNITVRASDDSTESTMQYMWHHHSGLRAKDACKKGDLFIAGWYHVICTNFPLFSLSLIPIRIVEIHSSFVCFFGIQHVEFDFAYIIIIIMIIFLLQKYNLFIIIVIIIITVIIITLTKKMLSSSSSSFCYIFVLYCQIITIIVIILITIIIIITIILFAFDLDLIAW